MNELASAVSAAIVILHYTFRETSSEILKRLQTFKIESDLKTI